MGLLHGAYCLGCCWLLFVMLFPLGIMNVGAMAAVTLIIFAEKTLPWPRPAPYATAGVLVLYGALVITSPQLLPTFQQGRYAGRNADDDARREVADPICASAWRTYRLQGAQLQSLLIMSQHSHMLRHSCGYKLANDGQDTRAIQHYLGHKSINSTVRYAALAPDRFKGFWKD